MNALGISSDQLSVIVAKSIMDGLTPEVREKLISDAVSNFLTRGVSDRYGSVTHLQDLFNQAVIRVGTKLVEETLAQDEGFTAKIEAVLQEAISKAFADESRAKLVSNISTAIARGIAGRDY